MNISLILSSVVALAALSACGDAEELLTAPSPAVVNDINTSECETESGNDSEGGGSVIISGLNGSDDPDSCL